MSRASRLGLVTAAAAATLAAGALVTTPCLADGAQPAYTQTQPQRYGAQTQASEDSIVLAEERIDVTCEADGPWLDCHGMTDQVFENPTDAAVRIYLETDEHTNLLQVDGETKALPAPSSAGVRRFLDFVEIAAHQRRKVHTSLVRFSYRGDSAGGDVVQRWALNTRHPQVAQYPGKETSIALFVKGADPDRLPNARARTVTLRVPAGWGCEHDAASVKDEVQGDVRTLTHQQADAKTEFTLTAVLRHHTGLVFDGGPIVAVGFGGEHVPHDWSGAMRVRYGWEFGVWDPFVVALTGETIGLHREVAAIEVLFGTPSIPKLPGVPSLSLGVGMPVAIARSPEFGFRMQGGLTWWLGKVSLGGAVIADYYPSPHRWSVAPYLQLGI